MKDTDVGRDADMALNADTERVAMDTAAVTTVTTEEAARIAGVSARTIRRWIQQGALAAVESERGKLVSPADLPAAKDRAGRGHGHGHYARVHSHGHGHETMVTDTDAVMATSTLSSATAQMEAIRDEWLRPLIDRIEELSRETGRLEQERDDLRRELAELRGQADAQNASRSENKTPLGDDSPARASEPFDDAPWPPKPASDALALRWRRWWRRLSGNE
jgi:excisionase family DNA binding protein